MANPPHPLVNVPLPTGSPPQQPVRLSPFPRRAFPECSNESPLDLNASQKLSQSANKPPSAYEPEQNFQPDQRELAASPSFNKDTGSQMIQEIIMSDGAMDCTSDKMISESAPAKIAQRSRCHWSHNEVMALFNAKKAEAEKYNNENIDSEKAGKKMRVSSERWDEIAEYCKSMGSNKLASQCKDKWERIWSAFRKIMDWEKQIPAGKRSFWAMQGEEREKEGFPRVFDRELFDAMVAQFGALKSIDVSTIVIDSSTVEELAVETGTNAVEEPVLNQLTIVEESPSVVEDQTPASVGQKRKSTPRRTIKRTPLRPAIEAMQAEENGVQKASKEQTAKAKLSADLNERKLLLEERKLKLAEKRFQLEERKLEATIEIGKGLIASMERMTQTISSLGTFPSH